MQTRWGFVLLLLMTVHAWAAPSEAPLQLQLGSGVSLDLHWIEPGVFQMGTDDKTSDEWPRHEVTISHGFWMGTHEVTQAQWQQVMGANPSQFKGEAHPVERVSWEDVRDFLKKLNHLVKDQLPEGHVARLPTEAEWVYACRAGTRTAFWFGDDANQLSRYGNFADASETLDVPWRDTGHDDHFAGTAPVGSFPPNPWGLHDMHGNVWEWCEDWYGPYPTNAVTDPRGPEKGRRKVIRGGGWGVTADDCRSANRYRFKPDVNGANIGLRVIIAPPLP